MLVEIEIAHRRESIGNLTRKKILETIPLLRNCVFPGIEGLKNRPNELFSRRESDRLPAVVNEITQRAAVHAGEGS
jgi:hypothetical protein